MTTVIIIDRPTIEFVPAPPDMLTLSQAIREGARMRPQAFCFPYMDGATCALGAAFDAAIPAPIAEYSVYEIETLLIDRFPELLKLTDCPARCACIGEGTYLGIIEHLNDCHEWSREDIASWVAEQGW